MLRDFFTNKWFLWGISYLIVLTFVCLLWYQYDIAHERKILSEGEEILRKSEIFEKVSDMDSDVEQTADAPIEINTQTAKNPKTNIKDEFEKEATTDKNSVNPIQQTAGYDKEMRVSSYGFGPYPDLPPGFPDTYWNNISKEHELIARVWFKLRKEGVDVVGGAMQNGLVYPSIPETIYVEWDYVGVEKYVQRIAGDPKTVAYIRNLQNPEYPLRQRLTEKDIPPGVTVKTFPDGGIDPYHYLNLEKE
ncbi:hypothetical protein C6497_05045 [Candidatus Poribacteria bacterium]|nr:MAG: hypothetical protein C6497_05045 [Candidatus Poribacteria bacterium]